MKQYNTSHALYATIPFNVPAGAAFAKAQVYCGAGLSGGFTNICMDIHSK